MLSHKQRLSQPAPQPVGASQESQQQQPWQHKPAPVYGGAAGPGPKPWGQPGMRFTNKTYTAQHSSAQSSTKPHGSMQSGAGSVADGGDSQTEGGLGPTLAEAKEGPGGTELGGAAPDTYDPAAAGEGVDSGELQDGEATSAAGGEAAARRPQSSSYPKTGSAMSPRQAAAVNKANFALQQQYEELRKAREQADSILKKKESLIQVM